MARKYVKKKNLDVDSKEYYNRERRELQKLMRESGTPLRRNELSWRYVNMLTPTIRTIKGQEDWKPLDVLLKQRQRVEYSNYRLDAYIDQDSGYKGYSVFQKLGTEGDEAIVDSSKAKVWKAPDGKWWAIRNGYVSRVDYVDVGYFQTANSPYRKEIQALKDQEKLDESYNAYGEEMFGSGGLSWDNSVREYDSEENQGDWIEYG